MAITVAGVLSVLAFIQFPTVYEAHGYFHSTLTPPLVVAIFMGVFWKRFTPAGVITTFLGGVVLMILGARFPEIFISPFDHGIEMNPDRPYSYIRAFYNLIACVGVGVFVTMTTSFQHNIVSAVKKNKNSNTVMIVLTVFTSLSFILAILGSDYFLFPISVIILVPIIVTYYGNYDEELSTKGLTVYSISEAKKAFKGSELNETHGEQVEVKLQLSNHDEDKIMCSKNDLLKLGAEVGDLVYLSDKRKWLGGLKSIHSRFGKSHNEDGIVYLNKDQIEHGLFDKDKILIAEKEM
jgi:SSS family solute:Na+ symporter